MKLCSITLTSYTRENIVAGAIHSVVGWVDECLLVTIERGDDDTLYRAAEAAGHKLRRFSLTPEPEVEWRADWRNVGLAVAMANGCSWACILDTDERIDPNGLDIRKYLSELPLEVEILSVLSTCGTYPKARFFRLPTAFKFRDDCHEWLGDDVKVHPMPRVRFHELAKSDPKENGEAILIGVEAQRKAEPDNPRWHYYHAVTLESLKRYNEAIPSYTRFMRLTHDPKMKGWAAFRCALCLAEENADISALFCIFQGLSSTPGMAELHYLAGLCCVNLGRIEDGISWELAAISQGYLKSPRFGLMEPDAVYDGPFKVLAEAYSLLGNESKARWAEAGAQRAAVARKNYCEKGEV